MLREAISLATSNDAKEQIIDSLQRVVGIESLAALRKYMADASLRDEAHNSAIKLAWKLRKHHSDEAIATAEQITKSDNAAIAERARELLDKLEKNRACILAWMAAGPYRVEGEDRAAVFETAYPPESGRKKVDWKELTGAAGDETISLEDTFGGTEYTAAYVRTTVVSPREQTVRLEMGSDDGIKAWLNGELVHSNWVARGCTPGEDVKTVKLRKGKNEILLKIVNRTRGWSFSCRLTQENGKYVRGLTVEP